MRTSAVSNYLIYWRGKFVPTYIALRHRYRHFYGVYNSVLLGLYRILHSGTQLESKGNSLHPVAFQKSGKLHFPPITCARYIVAGCIVSDQAVWQIATVMSGCPLVTLCPKLLYEVQRSVHSAQPACINICNTSGATRPVVGLRGGL